MDVVGVAGADVDGWGCWKGAEETEVGVAGWVGYRMRGVEGGLGGADVGEEG